MHIHVELVGDNNNNNNNNSDNNLLPALTIWKKNIFKDI